jgi:hypothetical protein
VHFGRGLHPGGASPDHDEGEQAFGRLVAEPLGPVEAIDHAVAHPQRIAQTLDVHGVGIGTGGAEEGGAAARTQDQVIVRIVAVGGLHPPGFEVYARHLILIELHAQGPEDTPEGMGDVLDLRVARDDRGHHRPERGVVHAVHQRDPHVFGPTEHARQLPRYGKPPKPAADDEDLRRRVCVPALERGVPLQAPVGRPSRPDDHTAHCQFALHPILASLASSGFASLSAFSSAIYMLPEATSTSHIAVHRSRSALQSGLRGVEKVRSASIGGRHPA